MLRGGSLPPELLRRPFTVAEALEAGVSRRVLRNPDLRRPFTGVRIPPALPDDLVVLCRAAALVLPPGSAFSRTTAARLLRLPLPSAGPHRTGPHQAGSHQAGSPLCVVVPAGTALPVLRGVKASHDRTLSPTAPDAVGPDRRGAGTPPAVVVRDGVRVTAPARTWCDLAPELDDVSAVALGDAVLRRGVDVAALMTALATPARRRGAVRLRRLAVLLRGGVDSPRESALRVLLMAAGLPEPSVNRDVSEGGGRLARPDLAWTGESVAVDDGGDHHRTDRRQWRNDHGRRLALEDAGWRHLVLTAEDLDDRPLLTAQRVWRALAERGSPRLGPLPGSADLTRLSLPSTWHDPTAPPPTP